MALATTCPACSTSFKVNPEQLKLRRGLVRCGKCEHVFSGVEYLRYVSDSQTDADLNPPVTDGDRRQSDRRATRREPPTEISENPDELDSSIFTPPAELAVKSADPAPPEPAAVPPNKPAEASSASPGQGTGSDQPPATTSEAQSSQDAASKHNETGEPGPAPTSESTAVADKTPARTSPLTQSPRSSSEKPASAAKAKKTAAPVWPSVDEHFDDPDIEEPNTGPAPGSEPVTEPPKATRPGKKQSAPKPNKPKADDEDAIDFFGQTSRPTFDFDLPSKRAGFIAAGLACLLVIQIAVGNRDILASRFPSLASTLSLISAPFGLSVELPLDAEAIKIASFDLVTASAREPGASYVMNLLMRNKAAYTVRWPALELTLLDEAGGILVRKVLLAEQYITDQPTLVSGLPASSEKPIRVGIKSRTSAPVGYSVSLFYP